MSQGKFLITALAIVALITTLLPASSPARNSISPALGDGGIKAIQWKDFEPIQAKMYSCLGAQRASDPACQQVQKNGMDYLFDALNQAVVLNTLPNQDNSPRFCDSYAFSLVKEGRVGPGASYAILLIDERLQDGARYYGKNLPEIYLGKIVFDSLVDSSPCK